MPTEEQKKKRPPSGIANSNPWSYFTFAWIQPIILKGRHGGLTEDDLQELRQDTNDDTRTQLQKLVTEWDKELAKNPQKPSLWKVLYRVHGSYYFIGALVGFAESIIKVAEAVILGYIIRFFQDANASLSNGYLLALAMSLVGMLHATAHHHTFWPSMRTGMRVRIGLIALMYRKCLTLSSSSTISTGAIVNMISNDVQPFENATPFANYIWLGPLEAVLVIYFLYSYVGPSCFAGLSVFLLLIPVQSWFGRQFGKYRKKMVAYRDDRIRSLSDVLSGINLVKLSAWEEPMQRRINEVRDNEVAYIQRSNALRAANEALFFFFPAVVSAVTFITFWALGNQLRPDNVFTSITLFNVIRLTMTSFFPKAIESISEARISVQRITEFLLLPELRRIDDDDSTLTSPSDPENILELLDASFTWHLPNSLENDFIEKITRTISKRDGKPHESVSPIDNPPISGKEPKNVLKNLSFGLGQKELLAVVGPVGSGKSSLCMALLRELPLTQGTFNIKHPSTGIPLKIAYASQSPWIFAGTIRDNIIFGEQYDEKRFREVIRVCELERDLSLFAKAENELIGEKGVTLSGGQRARVSLARSIYTDADLYVMDDPLSAVDPSVGRNLFENCICRYLSGKPRVLVTHQLQYIKDCDRVLVLEHGKATRYGPVAQVMEADVDEEEKGAEKPRKKFLDVLREFAADDVDVDAESMETVIDGQTEFVEEAADSHNMFLRTTNTKETVVKDTETIEEYDAKKNDMVAEDRAEGSTPLSTYWIFFRSGSSVLVILLMACAMVLGQVFLVMTDWYISKWSSQSFTVQRQWSNPVIYVSLAIAAIVISLVRALWFFVVMLASSSHMFRKMLDTILRAPISFFHTQPHGRVLNRFSKDQSNVDELLPYNFFDATQCIFMLLGSIIIVCVVNYWVLLSLPVLGFCFYFLRQFYMITSRQVKRIESTTRSPVYSTLSETLDGLSTVRAFAAQQRFQQMFIDTQNDNVRAFFSYIGSARWLGFRLDFVASCFLAISTFACVASRATQSPELVGLSLSYVIQLLGQLQWAVRQSIEVEITFVSVERILSYTKLAPEAPRITSLRPPQSWPDQGRVQFLNMSLTYPGTNTPVLKNISVDIKPREKIGIVGRTGAGKSSLLTALFRLIESEPVGSIKIDGIPISELGTHDLRSKLSIIPQEPFLFKGNLRFNLDPFNEYDDLTIWQALEAAELKRKVERMPNGLETTVTENGKNFSVGERQLISLCRAILRRTRLIVMDEATANIDLASDRLIQRSIHTHFHDATVLTIAHRLNTVIGDYDRILVLEAGEVVEFGEPHELLQREDGWLTRMVKQTGPESERELRNVAEALWKRVHLQDAEKETQDITDEHVKSV